jgi:acyl-[acyl carrier protein]--UDP-N-acetylglucosamine O-acyltransferase
MAPARSPVRVKEFPGYFVSICTRCFVVAGTAAATDVSTTVVARATSAAYRAFNCASFRRFVEDDG